MSDSNIEEQADKQPSVEETKNDNKSEMENVSEKGVGLNQEIEEEPTKDEFKDKDKLVIFEKNDLLGGYSLAVKDNWGYKILAFKAD